MVGGGVGWWGWCGVVGGGVGCYTDKQNSHQAKKCSDKPAQEYNVLKRPRSIVVTTRSKRYDLAVSCLCSIKQCAKKHTCLMFPTGTFNSQPMSFSCLTMHSTGTGIDFLSWLCLSPEQWMQQEDRDAFLQKTQDIDNAQSTQS